MPKTVLIVEDDEDTRSIYSTAIAERGYRVLTASQGAEGVHLARRHRPDLILLDIRMPVMDGWQVMRYLKSFPHTRSIPVCAISAYAPEEEELEQIGQMEFDCFLMKPIDPRDIVAEVEARIGPPPRGPFPYRAPDAE
jgi:CheY-like chemotaxis protein